MTAPTKNYTVVPDSDVAADAPINTLKKIIDRDNVINIDESLGSRSEYTREQDHNHDSFNSKPVPFTLGGPELHGTGTVVISSPETWEGVRYYENLTISSTITIGNERGWGLYIICNGDLTISTGGKIDGKGQSILNVGNMGGAGGYSGTTPNDGSTFLGISLAAGSSGVEGADVPGMLSDSADGARILAEISAVIPGYFDPREFKSIITTNKGGGRGNSVNPPTNQGGAFLYIECHKLIISSGDDTIDLQGDSEPSGGSAGGGGGGGVAIINCRESTITPATNPINTTRGQGADGGTAGGDGRAWIFEHKNGTITEGVII